jgi:hypothetical protein
MVFNVLLFTIAVNVPRIAGQSIVPTMCCFIGVREQ